MPERSLLDLTVRELLDAVAARTSAPGGGAAAALTTALAAALTGMAARYGIPVPPLPDPDGTRLPADALAAIAERADALRVRAAALADADADAYAAYLTALRLPREDPLRATAVAGARSGAAAVPSEIAELGDAVSELALGLRHRGNPNLQGDVVAAVLLAAAATTTAAALVGENLGPDPRTDRARERASEASDRAHRATGRG